MTWPDTGLPADHGAVRTVVEDHEARLDALAARAAAQERVTITDANDLTYDLANTPRSAASLLVYLNGLLLQQTVDYTLSGLTVTFTSGVIANADVVTFVYAYGA